MRLKEYCAKKNITLRSIANHFGYAYTHFSMCARGIRRFGVDRAHQISKYCNGEVTIEDLLPPTKEKKEQHILAPKYRRLEDRLPSSVKKRYHKLVAELKELLDHYIEPV